PRHHRLRRGRPWGRRRRRHLRLAGRRLHLPALPRNPAVTLEVHMRTRLLSLLTVAVASCHGAEYESEEQGLQVGSFSGPRAVARFGEGAALTLRSQRHLVRLTPAGEPATYLLAIQQDGADGHGLVLFRSTDEARTFHFYAPIQNDRTVRHVADLMPVG